ncbi:carboxypeptidase-like regulatory domain-containing protein [Flavobacterium salmonis]|nr:carboxypeptidase-like regulatory domain-containing protein [Flavobacterium salmonis]
MPKRSSVLEVQVTKNYLIKIVSVNMSVKYNSNHLNILLLAFLFMTVNFYSQETTYKEIENYAFEYREIRGEVTDEVKFPIPDVVVFVKGNQDYVMTDKEGKFSIKIPLEKFKEKVFLRFEVLTLKPKEIEIRANTKYLKAQLNNNPEKSRQKWTWECNIEKPDITDLIFKTLDFIIANQKKKKKT